MADVTKTYHRTTYPAISSASNPQRGRTVLISGGSTGIGLAIARAFVEASADGVIFLGRRQSALDCATKQLYSARPSESSTRIQGISCDITKQEDVGRVWKQLNKDGVQVDVLVLCAAAVGISQVNQFSADHTWNFFQVNVLANLHLFQYFLEQGSGTGKVGRYTSQIQSNDQLTKAGTFIRIFSSRALRQLSKSWRICGFQGRTRITLAALCRYDICRDRANHKLPPRCSIDRACGEPWIYKGFFALG